MALDRVAGATAVRIIPPIRVLGFTLVSVVGVAVPPDYVGVPDQVIGSTTVTVSSTIKRGGVLDQVNGVTVVSLLGPAVFSANPPIVLAVGLTGDLDVGSNDLGDLS